MSTGTSTIRRRPSSCCPPPSRETSCSHSPSRSALGSAPIRLRQTNISNHFFRRSSLPEWDHVQDVQVWDWASSCSQTCKAQSVRERHRHGNHVSPHNYLRVAWSHPQILSVKPVCLSVCLSAMVSSLSCTWNITPGQPTVPVLKWCCITCPGTHTLTHTHSLQRLMSWGCRINQTFSSKWS